LFHGAVHCNAKESEICSCRILYRLASHPSQMRGIVLKEPTSYLSNACVSATDLQPACPVANAGVCSVQTRHVKNSRDLLHAASFFADELVLEPLDADAIEFGSRKNIGYRGYTATRGATKPFEASDIPWAKRHAMFRYR
ncbi:hypothetical protein KCU73_g98, partial [Aureobasidium melanogenum]